MTRVNPPNPITLEWLVDRTTAVYSLSLIYERLTETINHPRSSITDIARIITEDQGLTARLLKLANSPMFGYFSKIDSINKAVTVIGTQQLRDMALAVSVMETLSDIPEIMINMKSFWHHCIGCGIMARALATYRREINVERFFAAGILHDIGLLVMCTTIPDTVRKLLISSREQDSLYHEIESKNLGFNHADVGGSLLNRWSIPPGIVEPVTYHHTPDKAQKFPRETAIIHLADIICHALHIGGSGNHLVPALSPLAWDRLDIPATALATIIKQTGPQLEEIFTILGENAP